MAQRYEIEWRVSVSTSSFMWLEHSVNEGVWEDIIIRYLAKKKKCLQELKWALLIIQNQWRQGGALLDSWSKSYRWLTTLPNLISESWVDRSVFTATGYWVKYKVDTFVSHGILQVLKEPTGSLCVSLPEVIRLHETVGSPRHSHFHLVEVAWHRLTSCCFLTVVKILMSPLRTENETSVSNMEGSR